MSRKSIYFKLLSGLLITSLLYSCKSQTTTPQTSTGADTTIAEAISKIVTYDASDYYTDWKNETPNYIALNGTSVTLQGNGASISDSKITISAAGVYVISGKLDDGQIIVDTKDKDIVKLVLNGAEINSSNSASINVVSAEKTVISLEEGTDNSINDGAEYIFAHATTEEPTAAIYSKDDLTVNGNGKLIVHGNYKDGITSKDNLKITGGDIKIYSADDGLIGKDILAVKTGIIAVESGGDGIKASNDTEELKGYVAIEGGSFDIKSEADGIQANTSVLISGGEFNITSGGGSENATVKTEGNMGNTWGNRENNSDVKGEVSVKTDGAANVEETEEVSAKGIKGAVDVSIGGGTFKINSSDDALHSNKNLNIISGNIEIAAGDDGLHGDESLTVKDGKINITKSYEGLESNVITLSGGEIHITSKDDGINASEGTTEESGKMAMPGQGDSSMINIDGGYITVDASGDGLDSNGSISMTNGTVIVNGPTNSGNGAIDYDGEFQITGGLLMAAGSSGMAQATSEESSQYSIMMSYSTAQKAGTAVHLKDSKGNVVATFVPKKDYQSVVISSDKLAKGGTYTLYSGGTTTAGESVESYTEAEYKEGEKLVEFTIADSITWLNESGVTTAKTSNMGLPGGQGGQGGQGFKGVQMDITAIKTAYSDILKELVTAKIITQAQADKILVAATENMQDAMGGMKPDDKTVTDGTGANDKPTADGAKPDGTMEPGGGRNRNNSLSELVTSKVITQAQADAINQKLQEVMR